MGRGIVMRDTQRYDEDHEDQMAIRAEEHGELIGRQQGLWQITQAELDEKRREMAHDSA